MEQRSRHSDNQHNAEFTSASNKNRFTNSSNGKLHDVLPNINDVLSLGATNEYNTPIVADLDGEAEKAKVPAGTKLIFLGIIPEEDKENKKSKIGIFRNLVILARASIFSTYFFYYIL